MKTYLESVWGCELGLSVPGAVFILSASILVLVTFEDTVVVSKFMLFDYHQNWNAL
jgi:hypothetical protein